MVLRAVAGFNGTATPSGTAGGDLSGTYPNPTVTTAHITSGAIDGTGIGSVTPAPGAFTTLNATSANVLGPLGAEGISATTNGQAAGTTNTGVMLGSSTLWASETFFDSALTTNNKTADVVWQSGVFSLRFKNDAGALATSWLTASGGHGSGITGITSSSGSGSWAHTGKFSATGTITPSTTSGIVGTTLADNANAGSVGEVLTNTGTDVSLTTSTPANIASVTLTPGDWDVYGSVAFNGTASTSTSRITGGLNTVSATMPAQPYYYRHQYGVGGFVSATLPAGAVPMQRINVSTNTTVYLVAEAIFTASTETATAVVIARRVR